MIVDTAGRLQIDERLMEELREVRADFILRALRLAAPKCCAPAASWLACLLGCHVRLRRQTQTGCPRCLLSSCPQTKAAVNPTDTLLVVDAMTGQEAAGLVKAFNDAGALCMPCCAVLWYAVRQGAGGRGQGWLKPRSDAVALWVHCAVPPGNMLCCADMPWPAVHAMLHCMCWLAHPGTNSQHTGDCPTPIAVDITGAVLTKMDGDSRGGAALSIKEVGAALRCAALLCCAAVLCCCAVLCGSVHGVHFWLARPSSLWPHSPVGCWSQIDACTVLGASRRSLAGPSSSWAQARRWRRWSPSIPSAWPRASWVSASCCLFLRAGAWSAGVFQRLPILGGASPADLGAGQAAPFNPGWEQGRQLPSTLGAWPPASWAGALPNHRPAPFVGDFHHHRLSTPACTLTQHMPARLHSNLQAWAMW